MKVLVLKQKATRSHNYITITPCSHYKELYRQGMVHIILIQSQIVFTFWRCMISRDTANTHVQVQQMHFS